ncbi:hypothetical protein ADL29_39605 [Streptomyces chattanoogensis]|uniref:Uncharacterized protein n=1 Tax=Streptomyces chattanoogensis TaxID=66876 RepID=A0A0N1JVD8_9ACTN|nr:hypothetical protein ADL29_39605 [Streptomyces chattanoogensis]
MHGAGCDADRHLGRVHGTRTARNPGHLRPGPLVHRSGRGRRLGPVPLGNPPGILCRAVFAHRIPDS